jgi:hypothetical protein
LKGVWEFIPELRDSKAESAICSFVIRSAGWTRKRKTGKRMDGMVRLNGEQAVKVGRFVSEEF